MIVRLMGEGQYRLDERLLEQLNELDNQTVEAVEAGDLDRLHALLGRLHQTVRDEGQALDPGDLSASELIIPPDDLTLEEAREIFHGAGLIPDLPGAPSRPPSEQAG